MIVFLSYLSRSGSTYLSSLLDAHPRILVTLEADFQDAMLGICKRCEALRDEADLNLFLGRMYRDQKFPHWGIKDDFMRSLVLNELSFPIDPKMIFPLVLKAYSKTKGDPGTHIVYKGPRPKPNNWKLLRKSYPDAKMVYIMRDPRAVYASQTIATGLKYNQPIAVSPRSLALRWRTQAAELEGQGPKNLYVIRYEDLVLNTDLTLANLFDFLGVERRGFLELDAGQYKNSIPASQAHLHKKLRRAPDSKRISEWRNRLSPYEIALIESVAGKEMRAFGYQLESPAVTSGALAAFAAQKEAAERLRRWDIRRKRFGQFVRDRRFFAEELKARWKGW